MAFNARHRAFPLAFSQEKPETTCEVQSWALLAIGLAPSLVPARGGAFKLGFVVVFAGVSRHGGGGIRCSFRGGAGEI